MTVSKSHKVHRVLLVFVSLAFVLVCLEFPALIGILDYRSIFGLGRLSSYPTDVRDPELLHIHPPHSHYSGARLGGLATLAYQIPQSDMTPYQWDTRYDENGFRNERDLKSADIVVIGDSFVEDMTVPQAQLTTSLLARLQGKMVANLGQVGYGPQQELIVLKRYGLPLRPSTVVWMFYEGNDLQDVLDYDHSIRNPPTFWSAFFERSFTRNAVGQMKRLLLKPPAKPSGLAHSGIFQASDGKKLNLYFYRLSGPLTKEDVGALDETTGIIAEAFKLCVAQGSRLLVVFVPDGFRVFRQFCQFPEESQCRKWVPNDLPDRLRSAVGSVSGEIGYLDLTPNLVNALKKGAVSYRADDPHWSADGHRIAAEAINDYLSSTVSR